MCENWKYDKLAKKIKRESIDEMKHAERVIERILFLEGVPGIGTKLPLKTGANVKAQLENDLMLEHEAYTHYNAVIKACRASADNASERPSASARAIAARSSRGLRWSAAS